jgi:hypothetical protein
LKLLKLLILSGAALAVIAATNTAQATQVDSTEIMGFTNTTTRSIASVPQVRKTQTVTYLGKTAKQWHSRAVWRTKQRNKLKADAERLRTILRYEIATTGSHPLERGFLCIHSHEGAWNDPNAPYYGGLQMDMSFQRAYGSEFLRAWGTADNWPISVQMTVAMRAYLSGRGYNPWPATSVMCGLR